VVEVLQPKGGTSVIAAEQPVQCRIVLDKDIQPISEYVAEAKQKRFEDLLRHEEGRSDDHKIDMELKNVQALQVSLAALAECKKASQMTLINQKLYKVTAYFVKQHRDFKPKTP
jgi:hypothetical protein